MYTNHYKNLNEKDREKVDSLATKAVKDTDFYHLLLLAYNVYTDSEHSHKNNGIFPYIDKKYAKLSSIAYKISTEERENLGITDNRLKI